MAAYAARQLAQELAGTPEGEDAVIVVLLPDSGRGYLTKVFNDEWLAQYGFATGERLRATRPSARCCAARTGGCPTWCTPTPAETIAEAVRDPAGVRRLPDARGPRRAADRGRRGRRLGLRADPARRALHRRRPAHRPGRASTCRPPLPTIGSTEPARDAVALLEGADAVLVHEDGKPVGVLTRQDLLAYLAAS